MAALTFISSVFHAPVARRGDEWFLFVSEDDPPPREVVRTHLHTHLVARQNSDVMHPHLARDRGEYLMAVLQLDLEHRIAQGLDDDSVLFDQ